MREEGKSPSLALEMVEMEEGNHEPRNAGGLNKTRKEIGPNWRLQKEMGTC